MFKGCSLAYTDVYWADLYKSKDIYLDPYWDPCHDLVYGSNSSIIDGSFSTDSVLAQEQVMAEHKKTLIINMTRNKIPNAIHKYNNQGGLTPQSVQTDSTSEKEEGKTS